MPWVAVVAVAAVAAVAVVAAVLLDRAALWAERRGWLLWRRHERHGHVAADVLGPVIQGYQPGRAVVVEEQDRRRRAVRSTTDAAPPLGLDLERGTARLPRRRR